MEKDNSLSDERVPVIFIGHSKDEIGMQRTRRMFSTLNRYAKPVSMRDIIALDEDDIVAIASRNIIDESELFSTDRILDSKTKAIPDGNNAAITTIITYYECNKELLWILIKDLDIKGLDGKLIKGHKKINEYIRHRPDDKVIRKFTDECMDYWSSLIASCDGVFESEANFEKYRNKSGGHIFFRPAALIPFTKAVVRIKEKEDLIYKEIIDRFPDSVMWIHNDIWKKIIWDDVKKSMIMGNSKLIELILLYSYDKMYISEAERQKILKELESKWSYYEEDLLEIFEEKIYE